jgi:hypothetical protein
MRRYIVICICISLFASVCVAQDAFKAGAALRVVTPDPLLPVSGGVGEPRPTTQQLGDLFARALVMEKGDTRVAIVGVDFLGWNSVLSRKVSAQVPGIPAENILIGATHTHSAPDTYGFPDMRGQHHADLDYLDRVCAMTAEAINEAVEKLQPASLKIAVDEAKGKIAYNYYAPQLYDPRCSVLQAVAKDGTVIATLVNYASHPEIIGPGQGILSPDFCGPLYDRIEAAVGGVAIYMNGAQGGMVTADCRGPEGKDIQTWDECIRIGELLADEALRIVADAPLQDDPVLYCAAKTIHFPLDSPLLRTVLKRSPLQFDLPEDNRIPTRLNLVNAGTAQMITIPGEALPNIGYYVKRNMPTKDTFLLGLTNDAFGYIIAKVDFNSFKRYDYISRTSLGEMTGEIYMEEALALSTASPKPDPMP